MQTLQQGATLQGGKYKIGKVLGQGGFGITYLAVQSGLERKVAVKEFFMKELCVRDESTSHVTLGTEGSRETIGKFKDKFLKEARNIAKFSHPNIVHIIDVFEENGTAYYVMEYVGQGSLADKVKSEGDLSEPVATKYITLVAQALDYIHQRKVNHLDVKPANIMLNDDNNAVLIDFGLSKQYDEVGNQTSTTPVGISEGYAPMEQYKKGGVGEFSPETDIYALGATFFKLLTGETPPSASDVNEDGVPIEALKSKGVSDKVISVICKAMEGRKKDRMKSAKAFIDGLALESVSVSTRGSDIDKDESTALIGELPENGVGKNTTEPSQQNKSNPNTSKKWILTILGLVGVICMYVWINNKDNSSSDGTVAVLSQEEDSLSTQSTQEESIEETPEYTEEAFFSALLSNPRDLFVPGDSKPILYQEALVYGSRKPKRLLVFLHGDNGRGTDNSKPLELEPGPMDIVKYLIRRNDFGCYVLVPQLASGSWDSQCGSLKALIEKFISADPSIDRNQIYICGTSSGGNGTWNMVHKYPNFFRGAMPVATGKSGTPADCMGTRICYVTGSNEGDHSREANALKKSGVNIKYWYRPDSNHGNTCQTSFTDECLDWLFE